MSDQVKEVKSKADIVATIGERVKLKKAGRNFVGLCPFHNEKTPSFNVSAELQIFKCFGCFPAGEVVKTPFGFHKIEDVVEGEYVISGKGNFRRVLERHKRNYDGELITLSLHKLTESVQLTGDHMVYVVGGSRLYSGGYKYLSKRLHAYKEYSKDKRLSKAWKYFPIKKKRAAELEKGMTLLYPVYFGVNDVEVIDLSGYITKKWPAHGTKPIIPDLDVLVNESFLKLLGYYIAEGSNHRGYIRFSLGDHEELFAEEIVDLIDEVFGFEASIHRRNKPEKTGIEVTCSNSVIANIFENLCGKGAHNKKIPFVLQQLPFEKQRVLLEAVFKGDGHKRRYKRSFNEYFFITTVSRVLAEHLRDILLRLGYFPSVNVENEKIDKKGVNHRKVYRVYWVSEPKSARYQHIYEDQHGSKFWLLPIRSLERSSFKGRVYNLTVEEDHSYVANTFAVANCGEAGDIYEFLEKFEGMEFPEALRHVADKVGVKLKTFRPSKEYEVRERLLALTHLAAEFYHYLLMEHKIGEEARQYFKDRGIWKQTISKFMLGFAPDSWDSLQKYLIGKKKYTADELASVGLVISRRGGGGFYDRFRGRVMFPLTNQRSQVLGFAGRILEKQETSAKYINSPETNLYHKSELLYGLSVTRGEIKKADRVVVVEGELDVLSSWQVGVKNVVAIKGSAFTQEQVRLLSRYTKNVSLALDADQAGEESTKRGIGLADKEGINVRVVMLKGGKDPDEIAQSSKDKWQKLVDKAVNVYDFYISSALGKFEVKSGEGKRLISRELVPIIAAIENQVERAHYVRKLAKKLAVKEEIIEREVERFEQGAGRVPAKEEEVAREEKDEGNVLEEYALKLLLSSGGKVAQRAKLVETKWFEKPAVKRVMKILQKQKIGKESYDWDVGGFVESLPAELQELVKQVWLKQEGDGEISDKEWQKAVKNLRGNYFRKRLSTVAEKIEGLEKKRKLTKSEQVQITRLENKFVKISKKLTD